MVISLLGMVVIIKVIIEPLLVALAAIIRAGAEAADTIRAVVVEATIRAEVEAADTIRAVVVEATTRVVVVVGMVEETEEEIAGMLLF